VPLSLNSLFKLLFSFFSTYAGQDILDILADTLCPAFFPPGQECTLPLNPGEYGSLVGGPLDFTLPDIPDILCKYSGVWIQLLRITYEVSILKSTDLTLATCEYYAEKKVLT
jgi:hypothetical protein